MQRSVAIGHHIHGGELERILIEAAQDVGLTAISRDYHEKEYKIEDDGTAYEGQVYRGTIISLRRGIFPMIGINDLNREFTRSSFEICNGITSILTSEGIVQKIYFGSRKLIERYLTAVAQRLQNAESKDIELLRTA